MSVLINMEMPTSPVLFCIHPDGKVFADLEGGWREYKAIPVPPHGRLIDADALDIYRREEQAWHDYESNPDNEYLEGVKDGLHEAAKQLSTAPTIIPAEETLKEATNDQNNS